MTAELFETLGQYLRREREMRGISIAEVSDGTKVKVPFLEEIENGRHDQLPSTIYVQGFLRSYARYIGLDETEVLQRYQEAREQAASERERVEVVVTKDPANPKGLFEQFLQPAEEQRMQDRRQDLIIGGIFGVREGRNRLRSRSMVVGSLLGAAAAVLIGIYLLVQLFASPKETVITYRENMARNLATDLPKPVRTSDRRLSASQPDLDTLPSRKITETPQPTPPLTARPAPPPPLPAPLPKPLPAAPVTLPTPQETSPPPPPSSHELVLEATEKSWLQVRIDDRTTKEFLLASGDRVELQAEDGFDLTVGNAGGVIVTIDGKRRPTLGDHGVVVRNLKLP